MSNHKLKTRRRYQMCGSDYSAQEVRVWRLCSNESRSEDDSNISWW